jgi:(p)ppGpp synthase/HD superfamily hydrolase
MNLVTVTTFVRNAHGNQKDKAGAPYWLHPVRVMLRLGHGAPLEEKYIALLHDVLEDTDVTVEDLRTAAIPAEVIDAVVLLTRDDDAGSYADYISRLVASGNRMAIRVKLADLGDNLDPKRSASLLPTLAIRYLRAKARLQAALI